MPFCYASFNEKGRRRLALFMAFMSGVGALASLPCTGFCLVERRSFHSEAHYFIRHRYMEESNTVVGAPFAIKAGFGYFAFISTIFSVVLVAVAALMWFNADENRRFKVGTFGKIMSFTLLILLTSLTASFISFILMQKCKVELPNLLKAGIHRAMKNYDRGGNSSLFPDDKRLLDLLHLHHECCGEAGWKSFQNPAFFLQRMTNELKSGSDDQNCTVGRMCYVPWSCCRKEKAQCSCDLFGLPTDDIMHVMTLSDKGCVEVLVKQFVPKAQFLMTIALCYMILFYFLIIGHRWFHTSCNMVYEYNLPLTPGWICPCGGTSIDEMMEIYAKHIENRISKAMVEVAAQEEEEAEWEDVDDEEEESEDEDEEPSVTPKRQ